MGIQKYIKNYHGRTLEFVKDNYKDLVILAACCIGLGYEVHALYKKVVKKYNGEKVDE